MQVFEMVVLIVAICVIGRIIRSYLGRKHPRGSDYARDGLGMGKKYYSKKELAPFMAKFEAMEERIQVLERIATDKGRNLASEIDNLK